MYKFEKQFREDHPETIGETDKHFDFDNYKDWLEERVEKLTEALSEFVEAVETEEIIIKENYDNDGFENCGGRLVQKFKTLIKEATEV